LFHYWCRHSRAMFSPLWFKVLLSIFNVPTHIWSANSIQEIINVSYLVFEVASCSSAKSNFSEFPVVAWSWNPDQILVEVGCVVPELGQPFVEWQLPLYLHALESLHTKCDTLQFKVFIQVLEVHDFHPLVNSDDDGRAASDSSDSGGGCITLCYIIP
jgi:hypothetical protein